MHARCRVMQMQDARSVLHICPTRSNDAGSGYRSAGWMRCIDGRQGQAGLLKPGKGRSTAANRRDRSDGMVQGTMGEGVWVTALLCFDASLSLPFPSVMSFHSRRFPLLEPARRHYLGLAAFLLFVSRGAGRSADLFRGLSRHRGMVAFSVAVGGGRAGLVSDGLGSTRSLTPAVWLA